MHLRTLALEPTLPSKWALSRRFLLKWLLLVAILVAAILGYALAQAPASTVIAVTLVAYFATIARNPALSMSCGIITLALSWEQIGLPSVTPEITKLALILFSLPAIIVRRLEPRFLAVFFVYLLFLLQTILLSDLYPTLTANQLLSSFLTLTLGWVLFAVNWTKKDSVALLQILAHTAAISVVLGALLQISPQLPLGVHADVFDLRGSTYRLQGASIPAWLALLATIGTASSIALLRTLNQTYYRWIILLNLAIVSATIGRMAILATLVIITPLALYYLRQSNLHYSTRVFRTFSAVALLALLLSATAPLIMERNASRISSTSETGILNTSGRELAWREYLDSARNASTFGRGIGSTTQIRVSNTSFQSPHNEYIRTYVEVGYLGLFLLCASILYVIFISARRTPAHLRPTLWAAAAAFMMLSLTDNTLSTPHFAVPFALFCGALRSFNDTRRPSTTPKRTDALDGIA